MRLPVSSVAIALVTAILAGCVTDAPSENTEDGADEEAFLYRPINERGALDLIRSTAPPRDTSPACRVIHAAGPFRVLNLAANVTWEPTSERTRELRLTLATGSPEADRQIDGPSPLNLTTPNFNISADEKFGIVVSLIGEEVLDPSAEPQEIEFQASFVAQLDAERDDANLGLWTNECPEDEAAATEQIAPADPSPAARGG